MILKPSNILPDNSAFDGVLDDIPISWKNNGDTMVSFRVIVENNTSGTVVFNSGLINSYTTSYLLLKGILTNGVVYRFKITVYNSIAGSATSDYKIISCNSKPVITIPNDGYIRNQTATVTATYTQAQSIELKAYMFSLYDVNDNILEQSAYLYDGLLEATFSYTLQDDTTYKVECIAITKNDLTGTSGKISLIADYLAPVFHFRLTTQTFPTEPYVRLSWSTVRIIGKTRGNTNFIVNEKLNVTAEGSAVYFDDEFTLHDDFTLDLWVNGIPNEKEMLLIPTSIGSLSLKYYNQRFHVFKTSGVVIQHYATEELFTDTLASYHIIIRQIKKKINLICEVV